MNVAIIPARGGSKRIPKKNIKLFSGQPLIVHSIKAAQATGLFDKIVVSTDDAEIAEVANQYGAQTPFIRPNDLADDYTGTTPVIKHALNYLLDQGDKIDYCCCIYATAPLLQAKYLSQAFQALNQAPDKVFAFSVTSFPFPIQRSLKMQNSGVVPMFPEHIGKRSQDLEEAYHDAGQFYWGRANAFLTGKKTFAEHSIPVVLPRYLVQDIDTLEDWQNAELLYQLLEKRIN